MTDDPLDLTDEDRAMLATGAKEIAETAKKQFSLSARLKGAKLATAKMLVFLDLEAASEWQAQEQVIERLSLMVNTWPAGSEERQQAIDDMTEAEEKVPALRRVAMESALALHMRAVPQVAFEAAQREARKAFADENGTVPDEQQQAYFDKQNEILLGQVVQRILDATGAEAKFSRKTLAKELRENLGVVQFGRVLEQFNLLMFNDRLAQAATSDPGF